MENTLKEKLLALTPKPVEIDVPDLGKVHVRGMTGAEREAWEQATYDPKGNPKSTGEARAMLVIFGMCNEAGGLLLTPSDATAVAATRGDVLVSLAKEIQRLNGMGRDSVEESAKNSSAGTSGTSS